MEKIKCVLLSHHIHITALFSSSSPFSLFLSLSLSRSLTLSSPQLGIVTANTSTRSTSPISSFVSLSHQSLPCFSFLDLGILDFFILILESLNHFFHGFCTGYGFILESMDEDPLWCCWIPGGSPSLTVTSYPFFIFYGFRDD
ncbi:hypothetical protein RIF29_39470 [Crotalaria pallida]|uniref:Uncharacterized protein n=1 Tax=Crotalaria pallida TaxID=3830 RepID=A0AAN9E6N8_CROPI